MSAFPSAPFPEYGSCGSNYASHSYPYHQPSQSHHHHQQQHGVTLTHQPYHCDSFGQPMQCQMNTPSAPSAFPPYPPPYSAYPGQPQPGQMGAGMYPPQMAYPTQAPAGWYQGPAMGQPQVVHVVTSEPARSDSCGCCGSCCASLLAMCCLIECMEHCCHD